MVTQKAIRGEVRAIRQTRNLFRNYTRDLKSYSRLITRHPLDTTLISLVYK